MKLTHYDIGYYHVHFYRLFIWFHRHVSWKFYFFNHPVGRGIRLGKGGVTWLAPGLR